MSLGNVTFVLGQGGLGRPAPGSDFISGLLIYVANGSLPSGFTTSLRAKKFFSVDDAEAAGILDNYADATAAVGTVLMTAVGADGNTIQIKILDFDGTYIDLGTTTKTSAESTVTLLGAKVAATINAGTYLHGFSAVNTTGSVAISFPKRYGIFANTGTPIVQVLSSGATIATTITQPTGTTPGVASLQAIWHYHIAEFFRVNPTGALWVGFYPVPGSYDYAEVTTLQNSANAEIRQIAVFKGAALAASGADLTALSTICKANVANHKELVGLLGADISAVTDLSTLYNDATLTAELASVIIAQDGAALGARLYLMTGKSVTALGAALGAVSRAKVSESIAWVQNFNMSDGIELDTIAFANGQLWSAITAVNENLVSQLQNYKYIFLRKFTGTAGSYWNLDCTSIANSSDYSRIRYTRTIQKATRGMYSALTAQLNGPLTLNADGTLQDTTIAYLIGLAEIPLVAMGKAAELSDFQVDIDPTQNVLATDTLEISAKLLPIGASENITVKIGFVVSL